MKKFMIFLLMTVLYLGTCQARSEASHPNNGKLKLLSWVSPTPSESFLTPAGAPTSPVDVAVKSGDGAFAVSVVGAEFGCAGQGIILTAVVDGPVTSTDKIKYQWFLDGTALPGAGAQTFGFIPDTITALTDGLTHEFTVQVTLEPSSACVMQESPVHPFTMLDFTVSLNGPDYLCASAASYDLVANVTSTSAIMPNSYQWYKGADAASATLYATTTANTISVPGSEVNQTWIVKAVYGTVECVPADTNTFNVPTLTLDGNITFTSTLTDPVCEGTSVTLTATNSYAVPTALASLFTLGAVSYEWYINGELVATTTGSTYTSTFDHAGSYTVGVKPVYDNYDCTTLNTATTTVTVKAAPALTVTGDNVICAGQNENKIYAVATPAAPTGTKYVWTKPDGSTTTASTDNWVDAKVPGHYMVTMTTPAAEGGCTATAEFTIYQFGGNLQVSASEYYVCSGEYVVLSANFEGWTNENISYAWKKPGETDFTAGSSTIGVQFTGTADQKYYVKASVTSGTDEVCTRVDSIIVHPITASTASLTVQATPSTVCVGEQVNVKITAGKPTDYAGLYTWYMNGLEIPGDNLDSITLNMNQAGNYTFAATLANTVCGVPAPTGNGTVTVNGIDTVVAITGDNVICQGATATLKATKITGASYAWAGPDITGASSEQLTTTTPGVYAVDVTLGGCTAHAEFTVTQLGADLQVYASELNVCPNTTVTLNANIDGWNNQTVTYTWYKVGETAPLGYGSTIAVTPAATTKYAVKATGATCVMNDTIEVKVNSETATDFTVKLLSDKNICEGGVVKVAASVAGQYIWRMNGVEIAGQNLDTIALNLFAANTYQFSAERIGYQCATSLVKYADNDVTVHAAPVVTISGNNQICAGSSSTLTATVIPATGTTYKYTWQVPAGVSDPGNVATATADKPGVYTLIVEDNTSKCFVETDFTVYQFGADLQVTADKMEMCKGETVALNANLDGFNGELVTYAWTGTDLNASTGSSVSATPTTFGNLKYVVVATAGACTKTDSVIVKVNDATTATTSLTAPATTTVCEGQQVTITAASGTISTFAWYMNGVEIPGENLATLTMNMNQAGTYSFTAAAVVSGCSSSAVASTPVEITVNAAPAVTLVGNDVICAGQATNMISATPATAFSKYIWTVPNGTTTGEVAENQINANAPGVYTVVAKTATGCTSTDEFTVTQFGADLHVNADKVAMCAGETVVLTADLDGFNSELVNYTWAGNGIVTPNGSMVTATPAAGNQWFVLTATAGTCTKKDSVLVTVNAVNTVATTVTAAATVCQGAQATLTVTSPAASNYIWYMNGVEIPGENLPEITINMNEVGTFNFAAKADTTGCVVATVSAPVAVTVKAAPAVTIVGNNVICAGQALNMISATPAADFTSYSWTVPNGVTTTFVPANQINANVAGVYTVVAKTADGCTSTDEFTVEQFGADLQLTADKTQMCAGETVVLNANLDGFNSELVNYTWTGNGIIAPATGSTVFATPAAGDQQFVVTATAGACTKKDSITVTVNAVSPVATTVTGAATVCQGAQATLTVSSPTVSHYIWYKNGIAIPGESLPSITMNMDEVGTFNFRAKADTTGCVAATVSDAVAVTVNAAPEFTLTGNNIICNGDTAEITAAPATYTYTWQGGNVVSNAVHKYATAGTYSVTADNGTCTTTQTFNVYTNGSDLQVYADKFDVCAGETVVLNANLDGFVNNNIEYAWSGTSITGTGSTVTAKPTTSGNVYKVTATATGTNCKMEGEVTINVMTPGTVATTIGASTTALCQGAQVVLTVNPATATHYIWYMNGIEIPGENLPSITMNMNEAGTFNFTAMADTTGCVAATVSAPVAVTVNAAPEFTLSGNNIICIGQTAQITATPATGISYAWQGGSGSGNVHNYDNAGMYAVTATANGCTSTQTFNIYTNGSDLQVSADKMEVCAGEMVVLNANLDGFENNNITYAWSGTAITGTGSTVTAIPTTSGHTYTVTATAAGTTCQMVGTLNITVHPMQTVATTVTAEDPSSGSFQQTLCLGQQMLYLQATSTIGGTSYTPSSYTWYMDGLELSGESLYEIEPTITTLGTHYFAAKANVEGCMTSTPSLPEQYVYVHAAPEVTISGNNVICNGHNAVLTANATQLDPWHAHEQSVFTYTYNWSGGTPTNAKTMQTAVAGTYTVTVTSAYGCYGTASIEVNTFGGDLQLTASAQDVCPSTSVMLNANLDGFDNENIQYTWSNGQHGSTIVVNPTATTTYKVTAASVAYPNDCNVVDSIVVNVINETAPAITVTLNSAETICAGEQANFTASNANYYYTWYVNGVAVPGMNLPTVSLTLDEPGIVKVAARPEGFACMVDTVTYADKSVTVKAAPEFSLSGNNIICNGDTAVITASTNAYTYTWSGTDLLAPATDSVFATNIAGTYTVAATDGYCTTTQTFNVYTNGSDLQVYTDNINICEGETVVLNANLEGFVNNNITYAWSGNGVNPTTGSTVSATPTVANPTYKVTATAAGTNCKMEGQITFNVSAVPANMAAVTASKANICEGQMVTLTATTVTGAVSYIWYQDGIEIPGENQLAINVTLNEVGAHTFAVKAVNAQGCVSAQASAATTVTVDAAPQITITGNNVICNGASNVITAAVNPVAPSAGSYEYKWTGPATSSALTVNANEPGVYTFTVNNTTTGCFASAQFTVEQFGADLQVSASAQDVCPATSVMLNANLDGFDNENIQYAWSNGQHGSTIVVNPTATTTYKVTASTIAYETSCYVVDSIVVKVIDEAAPAITVTLNSAENICAGEQANFTASNANYYYTWYVNGVAVPGQNLPTINLVMNEPGVFQIGARPEGFACIVDTVTYANKSVTVHAAPEFSLSGNNIICNGDTAVITASTNAYTYTWSGTDLLAPATDSVFATNVAGTYTVIASDGICTSTQTFNVYTNGSDLQVYVDKMDICEGETVVLNANLDGFVNNNITYAWSGNGINPTTGSTISATPTVANPTYKVTATAAGTSCKMEGEVTINVTKGVNVTTVVTNHNDVTKICVGQQVVTFRATPSKSVDSFTWYVDGLEVAGQHYSDLEMNFTEIGRHFVAAKANVTGCDSATISAEVYVDVYAIPEVTISGNNVICNGDTAVLTATATALQPAISLNYYVADTYTYEWSETTTGSVMKTTVNGTYTVTVTSVQTNCTSTASIEVTTFGGELQMTANATDICLGETVVMNAQLNGMNNENVEYAWSGNGITLATGSQVSATPIADGVQKYFVTASAGNCSMKDSVEVNVTKGTKYTATVSLATTPAGKAKTCAGELNYYVATSTPAGITNYVWYVDGVEIPGENMPQLSYAMDVAGNHQVYALPVVTGCDTAVASAVLNIEVKEIPVIALTGNNVICNGDTAKITAAVTNGTATDYTYRWSNATADGAVLSATTGGLYVVTATLTAEPKCAATATVEVSIFGGDLQITPSAVDICDGEFITLNANLDGMNNENVEYAWTATPAGATLPNGSTIVDTPHVNTKYVVTAIAGNCEMKDSININVTPVINVTTVLTALDTICQGEQITITATATPAHDQFIWYKNGIEIPGENQPSIVMTMNQPGMFTFAAMANVDGCNTATVSANDTLIVLPTPVVTLTGDHYYTTDITSAKIVASVIPAGNYTYEWSNGEIHNQANHDTLIVSSDVITGGYGVYTVTVTSANGCSVVSDQFTVNSVVDLQAYITGVEAACQHDVVTLSAVVDYDLEGHTYRWLVNNNIITDAHGITGSNTAHLVFPVDSLYQNYGQVLANEFTVEIVRPGCDSVVKSPVHPFLITPVPYVYVAAPEKICKGDSTTLMAVVYQIGENAQYQYEWFERHSGTVTSLGTFNYVNTYDVPANKIDGYEYAVRVIYQDLACNSDTSEFVSIPFYTEPHAITLNIAPDTTCTTNQASVWITDPNTDPVDFGAVEYTWYVNGFEMPLAHGDTLVVDFDHNGAYTFWATASYANYPCAMAYTDTLTENVVMHPTVAITGDPIICHGDSIQLFATINDTVGSMTYSYEWRLYNYSLDGTITPNTIITGSPDPDAPLYVNNGNTTFTVHAQPDDPWLTVYGVNAQDYPYIFTAVITTPEGCRVESAPYYVYVNDTIHVVATVDEDTVCAAGQVKLTAHLGNWNADNLTAQWQYSIDNGATWTNIAYGTSGILEHIPGEVIPSSGTVLYRIHVIQTTSGCEAYSNPVPVEVVIPRPIDHIVAINTDPNYPTTNVCKGAQLEIVAYVAKLDASGNKIQLKCVDGVTDSVDANGQPVWDCEIDYNQTYVWKLNGINLNDINEPVFSAQAGIYDNDPVDYVYSAYIVYNIPGCELVEVASDTIHVRRNPIVIIEGNHNFCYFGPTYDNIQLTAWVDGDYDPDATYTWYKNGMSRTGFHHGYNNHYIERWEPSYDNPYEFTVEVTNGDGCTTISEVHYVNVYDKPVVNITASADSICENGSVEMRANLDNYNDPNLTFQWYRNAINNTNIILGATHEVETFYPVLGSTKYIVEVTHLMDYNQTCIGYDTFEIKVNPIPVVTAEYRELAYTTICDGRAVKIAAGVLPNTGIAGGEFYTWYRNGEVINGFNGDTLIDYPMSVDNEPAVYTYAVSVKQSASGCESQIFTLTPSITVNPNPALELTADPIVCDTTGNNITLVANMVPTTVGSPLQYSWYEDNHLLTGVASAITDANTISFHKAYRDYPYSFSVKTVNSFGCISEASALVYVNAEPVVHITATEDSICVGGEVTLTATLNDWNADQLTFQWFDGNDSIQGATELSYTVVPTQGTHKYHVEILQLTSLCHATSDTVKVEVVADPTITITYTANQFTVCDGYQVDLTTTVTGGVAGGEVYTWYRNGQVIEGAVSASYSEVVSALNGEPTTYDYAVSVRQAAAGCESNVYDQLATITVNPNPVVVLVTDPIVCDTTGNNITLTANMDPANVGSTVTFKWMEDNTIMDPATYTVSANNEIKLKKGYRDYPYNFSVEVVNAFACSASSEAQVYVNANPIVNTTVTEDTICVGGEITMTASLNDWNADMLTFQWFDNNQPIPGATSLSYTVVPAQGNHSYKVKVYQLTSECEATSIPFNVVVNPDPVVTLVSISDTNVCHGAQITVAATIDAHGMDATGAIYTWYRNGILIPGATAATIQDNPATVDNNIQHYTYTAVVTLPQAGCTSLPTTSAAVNVYPNPVVVISGDAHVCETDSVFLIANVDTTAFAVGNLHFTWYESGTVHDNMAYNLGDNRFFAEYFYPRDEPYVFTVNVERDDITAACAAMSAEYYVYVYPQPLVTVTASETMVCTDGEVTLTANLADYNADNLIYQWYKISYSEVTTEVGYDSLDNIIQHTETVAYRDYIPGATMPTFTVNPHVTTTYGVVVYQTNSTCWNNDEVTITVNPIPEVMNVTVSNDTVCNGTQVTIAATIDTHGTPADGAVYTWYRNGALIEGVTGASFSENVFTTDDLITTNSYTAVVTLPVSGCVSLESAPNTVTILPAPTTVSISGNNIICETDSTILTLYSNVQGNITWSTGSHENNVKVPAGTYTVTVETLGCQMTSEPFTVQAFGTDMLVSASATSICRGEHTTLYVDQEGWQGNVNYQWDAQAGNSTATTVDVHPDSTTTYHVTATVTSTNGSCDFEGEVTIIVHQLPAAFTVTASVDTICEGQQITFTAPANPQVTSYIWFQNGVEIPGENQNAITVNFNEAGNYNFAAKAISVDGCVSAEASTPVYVRVNAAPTTVNITGVNVICENSTSTLYAHSDVEGTWTWSNGSHADSIVVPAGVYNVTLTTPQGCAMTSDNFTVEALGTDLLVSASATSICEGEHTTLYVDQEGWQGNVTYAWDSAAHYSTASTVDVQPSETTTYHVTATVHSTNGTCPAVGEVTIIVTPRPAQVSVTATVDTICEGQQITFTASGNAYSYIWYQNGVEMAGENQASITVNFNEAGDYTFAAKAVNDQNCESAEASIPVAVRVNPAPTTVNITGVNIICEGSTTTLYAHSDVEGTWTWSNGSHANSITVPAGVYNVTMTTPEGCAMTSDNFTVEALGTDLLVSASATAICEGEHTTLYVDQEGWQGNVTYAWDSAAHYSTANTVDVQPSETTTYHVTATVSSTNGTCPAVGEVTIIVTPRPAQVSVTATVDTICEGQQITFTASGNAYSYIWYQNGVEMAGENQASITVNFNEAGDYTFAAKAVNDQNCESAEASIPVAVRVNAAPTTVNITGVNIICEGSTTTLYAHSDVEGTWTWSNGSHANSITVPAGVYNVTMTTPEGCAMTSDNFTVEALGTDFIVTASETSICRGEHTTLYANQEGWQGNVTYQWDAQAGNDTASTVDVQPAQTTTYHVTATVHSTNGSCPAEGFVTIIVNQLPVISAVTATETVVCEGTQVTFSATGDTNTTAYIWYNNGVEIPGENQAVLTVNFNEQGVYNYAVKAVSDQNCVSAVAFNAPAVTVNAAPQSVTISGELAICDGGSTTLYANVVPNETATYVWYKDNVVANATTSYLTVTEAGSYKVVASFNGCSTESAPVNVMVGETPQVQLTANEYTICVGGTTVITAEATGPNNAEMNYNWNNGFQGSAYVFTPTTAGTHTFMVTVSEATAGCHAADTINITVNAVPATPVVTVDNAVICDGGHVTLTVTNVVPNATYTWTKNNTVFGTGSVLYDSPVTVAGDETPYVYTVVASLLNSGCTSEASANTVVTVVVTPDVQVSVEGNTTVCQGGSTTLHANVLPANPNYTYQWYKDNVEIEGATQADYVAEESARETAYNYKVVVSANAGCDVTAYAAPIMFVADPHVAINISNNISCVGGTATLTITDLTGGASTDIHPYTYAWYKNNDSTVVGTEATYTTDPTDGVGDYTYWVVVTSEYGCQSTSENVLNYSIVPDPTVTISVATGYPTTVCDGGATMLKANVNGGYGNVTYQWYKNNNLLVGETNQTLNVAGLAYNTNDVYTVEVAQTGVGCSNNADASISSLVTVYPAYTVAITGFGNVCEGGTLTLNANVTTVDPNYNNGQIIPGDVLSYQWYRIVNGADAVAIYGANSAQYSTSDLLINNQYDYYVVVTSAFSGCSVVSNSVPASVVEAPTVTIQGANTVCDGGALTLNAFVNGGVDGAAYTYTWTWTGAANGTATTATANFTPTTLTPNDLATPYYFTVMISRNDNTGCTATSEAHEVNVLSAPTVTVTADNSYICQNGEVSFTAHVSPVGAYNYVWTINGQQQADNAATVTTTMATTGSISASVVVSAANASGSCTATDTIDNPVQVVAAPTVTLNATKYSMCVGGVTTLTASVNVNSNISDNFNYEWIVDGTPISAVDSVLNQTLNAAGVHTYKVRVSHNNNLGCVSGWSNQATVQVAEQPIVTLNSEDGLAICEGGSITLTGVVTNYNNTVNGVTNSAVYGNMVFDWTSNGVNIHHNTSSNAMNQVTETLNNIGNYTYQVAVTPTGYNCQPQISNEYTVNVVGNPTWTDVHVYSNNGTDACFGEMAYLMAGIEGGVSDYASSTNGYIQWTVTDGNGNTANVSGGLGGTSYDIPAAAGTYIYKPTYVGNIGSGCQLANTNSVQVAVTVHELPTAEFTSGDSTALCSNDPSASAALVISFNGTAPFTYEVVDNNNNVIAHATTFANTATIYVAPEQMTTYRINLISDNYCENPAIGEDITATVFVNDIEFPETFFQANCGDTLVTAAFNMISGNVNANFTAYYPANGLYRTGVITNGTATFAVPYTTAGVPIPGDYDVILTIDGCSYNVTVRVPVSDFGFGGTLPIMDQRWNDVVVVNNNPETNGGHTFVGFQWYHNGVAIPGATYSNYQDKGGLNGFYSVELTEQDADGNMITYMTCESYFTGNSSVKVYPVPANVRQEITIELELTSEQLEGAVLDIYSVTGALISHVTDLQPITKIQGFTAQGTYFGRILTGTNEIKTVKFIIVK